MSDIIPAQLDHFQYQQMQIIKMNMFLLNKLILVFSFIHYLSMNTKLR